MVGKILLEAAIVLLLLTGSGSPSWAKSEGPTFKVKKGVYLWHVWRNPPYRQHFSSWTEFKESVATLNEMPNTERAFRSMKSNTELVLPELPGTEARIRREAEKASAEEAGKSTEAIEELKKENQELAARLNSWRNVTGWFWLLLFTAIVIAAAVGAWIGERMAARALNLKNKLLEDEIVKVRDQIAKLREEKNAKDRLLEDEITRLHHDEVDRLQEENEVSSFFLSRYTVRHEVPENVGLVLGKRRVVHLLKAEPIEGEDAVLFYKGEREGLVPVKRKNVEFDLGHASPDTLRYYGIQPGASAPGTRK